MGGVYLNHVNGYIHTSVKLHLRNPSPKYNSSDVATISKQLSCITRNDLTRQKNPGVSFCPR